MDLSREESRRVLGVRRGATSQEIKSQFRQLAKRYHPDKHVNNDDVTKKCKSDKTVMSCYNYLYPLHPTDLLFDVHLLHIMQFSIYNDFHYLMGSFLFLFTRYFDDLIFRHIYTMEGKSFSRHVRFSYVYLSIAHDSGKISKLHDSEFEFFITKS